MWGYDVTGLTGLQSKSNKKQKIIKKSNTAILKGSKEIKKSP